MDYALQQENPGGAGHIQACILSFPGFLSALAQCCIGMIVGGHTHGGAKQECRVHCGISSLHLACVFPSRSEDTECLIVTPSKTKHVAAKQE